MTSELGSIAGRPEGRFVVEPHHCFACGELNDHGLRLDLHAGLDGCWTELTLDPAFQGWEGIAHGGILCAILDEVMAWAVIGRDTWGVTARMTVDFKRPVEVRRRLRAEGTVSGTTRRLFRTAGRILDVETGEVLATSEGTYIAAPPERLAELRARYRLPADDRSDAPGRVDS